MHVWVVLLEASLGVLQGVALSFPPLGWYLYTAVEEGNSDAAIACGVEEEDKGWCLE